ncbi:MAG: Unknown protein [uncultured Aureispira sp.]|uniref:Uncharacterized protein n=1 Tax=uncultured Aureispira sp. TaxID=1331704 RepID=A0A6S6UIK7_9BACT|nr:MAG: Unknown protein [uncultured Aureispira sp.]
MPNVFFYKKKLLRNVRQGHFCKKKNLEKYATYFFVKKKLKKVRNVLF